MVRWSVMLRRLSVVLVVAVAATGCASDRSEPQDPAASPTGDTTLWLRDLDEPYPFTTPIPPRTGTPIDGTYTRDYRVGSEPPPCIRCAPYRLDQGLATLELRDGRFLVEQAGSRFRARGHYLVEGHRLILFNDGNCPQTQGLYRWSLDGGRLTLTVVDDPCPFDLLRSRFLTAMPWSAG